MDVSPSAGEAGALRRAGASTAGSSWIAAWSPRGSATWSASFRRSPASESTTLGAGRSTAPPPPRPRLGASPRGAAPSRSATPATGRGVGSVDGARAPFALGYGGTGGGPSRLGGRVLASLAWEGRDEPTRLPIVDPPAVRVPPEPLRYAGGTIVRAALRRRERL